MFKAALTGVKKLRGIRLWEGKVKNSGGSELTSNLKPTDKQATERDCLCVAEL
jgi:hypothetical protein